MCTVYTNVYICVIENCLVIYLWRSYLYLYLEQTSLRTLNLNCGVKTLKIELESANSTELKELEEYLVIL